MRPEEFQQSETKLDAIAEQLGEWLDAEASQQLKQQLTVLGKQLGLSINLELTSLHSMKTAKARCLCCKRVWPLTMALNHISFGPTARRCVTSPMEKSPSSPMTAVPVCWSAWDFKHLHPTCETCGSRMGHEVQAVD